MTVQYLSKFSFLPEMDYQVLGWWCFLPGICKPLYYFLLGSLTAHGKCTLSHCLPNVKEATISELWLLVSFSLILVSKEVNLEVTSYGLFKFYCDLNLFSFLLHN